jgi:hypothetical protein
MDVDCQWDVQQLGERWESQKEGKQRFHAIPCDSHPVTFQKKPVEIAIHSLAMRDVVLTQ